MQMLQEIYDKYMKEANKAPVKENVNVKDVDVAYGPFTDPDMIMHEMQDIESKSDEELYKILGLSYKSILNVDFINKGAHRIQIAKAFTNTRFVSVFSNVVSSQSAQLTGLEKIACNKLIYDYFTMTSGKNDKIVNILYNLGWVINKEYIVGLYGKGMDQNTLTYLAVSRWSTTDTMLAVKRVNVVIMNQPLQIMTEQTIVNIYEELFSENLTSLFNGIMFDTWDDSIDIDEEQEEIYGTINLALLDIVNEMPLQMIVQLLCAYAQSKQYCHSNQNARFDIHSISNDYLRILQAICVVEQDGIMVPHR